MTVNWDYYDKAEFSKVNDLYLPKTGEGETKATQIVTAVNKLIYKYYNDGDVFDNTQYLRGWANDLSDFANWLDDNVDEVSEILNGIFECKTEGEYEDLLKDLADKLLNVEFLEQMDKEEKQGTIYDCNGKFKFVEVNEDEDEEFYEYTDEDYY